VTARPGDPASAVSRMTPPSDDAAALLANHGIVPGSLAEPAVAATVPAATTPEPVAVDPAVAPVTTPAPTVEPPPTAEPPPTTTSQVPAAGGAVAGQG
jgi:hypothetical protein